jgi:hypothetical protein
MAVSLMGAHELILNRDKSIAWTFSLLPLGLRLETLIAHGAWVKVTCRPAANWDQASLI